MIGKKLVWLTAILILLADPIFAGRSVFECSATVISSVNTNNSWWRADTWDVFMRGDDGKVFLLHFHGKNLLEGLVGWHLYLVYTQEASVCQTGYIDEVTIEKADKR